jgi:SAM-dependent methyltransferase
MGKQTETADAAGELGHDWRVAGEAWGAHAAEWACLYEHYSIDVLVALFAGLSVGPGVDLVDIACGSGLAVRLADATGATVAGIDASADLVGIARERTPGADLRVGSMYELPWPDGSFDAAVSINGIWGGCAPALDEAFRVLRPGGRIGISFWGEGPPLDIKTLFRIFAANAPTAHRGSMRHLNEISVPGVAEEMLESSGFAVVGRDRRISVGEWPDAETAWRAVASVGPAVPALRAGDRDQVRREVLDALETCRDRHGIYRIRSDQQFVTGLRL